MSHNAYRMLLFRAQAASRPKLILAYHEIVRGGPGNRLFKCGGRPNQSHELTQPASRNCTAGGILRLILPCHKLEIGLVLLDISHIRNPKEVYLGRAHHIHYYGSTASFFRIQNVVEEPLWIIYPIGGNYPKFFPHEEA